jgi:hypothetical protein
VRGKASPGENPGSSSRQQATMKQTVSGIASAMLLISAAHATDPTAAALQRCRQIADSLARVACYDAIPLSAGAAAQPIAATAASTPLAPVAPAALPPGRPTAAAAAVAPMAAPAPAGSAPVPAAVDPGFGLPAKPAPATQEALESTIAGIFDGWVAGSRLTLGNGQVWQVLETSPAAYSPRRDPRVRITRGLLGSYFMEIEGVGATPRVKRLQ